MNLSAVWLCFFSLYHAYYFFSVCVHTHTCIVCAVHVHACYVCVCVSLSMDVCMFLCVSVCLCVCTGQKMLFCEGLNQNSVWAVTLLVLWGSFHLDPGLWLRQSCEFLIYDSSLLLVEGLGLVSTPCLGFGFACSEWLGDSLQISS